MLKIPFSFLPPKVLKALSRSFLGIAGHLKKFFPSLKTDLIRADFKIDEKEYIAMCIPSALFFFILFSFFLSFALSFFGVQKCFVIGPIITLFFTFFVFVQQMIYPKVVAKRQVGNVERNLLPALQSILVQINSGVPLFDILVNVSKADYGQVSAEFTKAVKEISAGKHQLDALEELAVRNPSIFFRRAIWQIVNGMRSGADIASVVKDSIDSLSEEQLVQIQTYGSQLNPLAMFYMLIAVIVPALSITFIIIISSFVAASESGVKMVFWGFYIGIIFFQIIFLGLIKSRRPNLL